MRRVHCTERQIGEERAVGPDRDRVVDESQRVVDQVFAQVIAVFGRRRWFDRVVVVDELGIELVGLTLEEPVVAVEAPLAGPLVVGPGRRRVLHIAEVPFAEGEGRVALVPEDLGDGGRVVGDLAAHVGVAAVEVRKRTHPDRVVVPPGQERRTGGRAQRGHMEIGVAKPAGCQPVDVGRRKVRSEARQVGEPGVVEENEHHVRCILARMRCGFPPGCGLRLGSTDHPVKGAGQTAPRTRVRHER